LPNPAPRLTAKAAQASLDADGVKAPKNVYLVTASVPLEIRPIVPNGSSNHVLAQNALNIPTVAPVQMIHFAAGVLTAEFAVKLTRKVLSMATATT